MQRFDPHRLTLVALKAAQPVQHRISVQTPNHLDGQALLGVLIRDSEEPKGPAVA